jgi:uncharacterized protein
LKSSHPDFSGGWSTIQINVSQLLKAPLGAVRNYKINDTVNIGGNSLIQGEIQLMRTDRGILARGTLGTEIELNCSRCLNPFYFPLRLTIEEEYFPTADVSTGASLPPPIESGSFTTDERNILDLSEAIRQYALLTTPIKPVCREDCAGLCPTCGANLNQTQCNCPPRPADLRWSKLIKSASDIQKQ